MTTFVVVTFCLAAFYANELRLIGIELDQ